LHINSLSLRPRMAVAWSILIAPLLADDVLLMIFLMEMRSGRVIAPVVASLI
jgi:hypothetical protein